MLGNYNHKVAPVGKPLVHAFCSAHLCPLGPEFLLSNPRLSALTTRGRFYGTPLNLLPELLPRPSATRSLRCFYSFLRACKLFLLVYFWEAPVCLVTPCMLPLVCTHRSAAWSLTECGRGPMPQCVIGPWKLCRQ